jgi:hypothetical protein
MNALKQNNPAKDILSTPKMGEFPSVSIHWLTSIRIFYNQVNNSFISIKTIVFHR